VPLAQQLATQIASGQIATPTTSEGWNNLIAEFSTDPRTMSINPASPLGGVKAADGTPAPATSGTTGVQTMAPANSSTAPGGGNKNAFVTQMTPWAQYASSQTGLDPNLILAQWGNETGWGSSHQWTANFNPAGIGITSDAVAGQGFGSVKGGVDAYVNFLKTNSNYNQLLQTKGAQAQAVALGNSGWAAGKYDNGGGPGSSLLADMAGINAPATNQMPPVQGATVPNMGSSAAINFARSVIGTPYVWGGESAQGYDCSGLTQAAFKSAGVNLPRVAQDQYNATPKVDVKQLQAGDLVFFGQSTSAISHVGIYIGNGQMVDAPHTGAQVRTESIGWGDLVGATRPIDQTGTSALPQPVQQQATGNYNQILSHVMSALAGGK
jgi:cell wall-associated NlpC family hydrolase